MRRKYIAIFLILSIFSITSNNIYTIPAYGRAYIKILQSQMDEKTYFSLYDFNNDKIPELLIIHSNEKIEKGNVPEADKIEIYSYMDDSLKKLYEMVNTNAYLYYKNENLIVEYADAQGTPCEVYHIQQDELRMMQCGYSDENGVHINWNCLNSQECMTYNYEEAICARTVLVDDAREFTFYKSREASKIIKRRR